MARIYISSTFQDLEHCRKAVYGTLRELRHDVISMEDYVAEDRHPLDNVRRDVATCDVYIGIFAWRYGYIPLDENNAEQKSITELEYRHAKQMGKECLIFLLHESAPWPKNLMEEGEGSEKLKLLRNELDRRHQVKFFSNAKELAVKVSTAVSNWQMDFKNSPPIESPKRDVTEDALLVYYGSSKEDEEFAQQLTDRLKPSGCKLLLSPNALFAKRAEEYQKLETNIRKCRTAAIVLSDAMLNKMSDNKAETERIINILKARTGYVLALCRTENSLKRAQEWGFVTECAGECRLSEEDEEVCRTSNGRIEICSLSRICDVTDWNPVAPSAYDDAASRVEKQISIGTRMHPTRTIGLPLIVVAMTRHEAIELYEHSDEILALNNSRQFHEFKAALEQSGRSAFAERYQPARENWKPFGNRSIIEVITDMAKSLNETMQLYSGDPLIKVQYYSFDPLIRGEIEVNLYQELADMGCVVLLDEISMFHPKISASFSRSPLVQNKSQAAIVTISPVNPYGLVPNKMLEAELEQSLTHAFNRFSNQFDPKFEFGVGNERSLKRCLHRILPATLDHLRNRPADPDSIKEFSDKYGRGLDKQKVANFLYSK